MLEFDWLRMFWIQGQKHANSHHAFWQPQMATLHAVWSGFEVSAMQCGLKLLEAMMVQEEEVLQNINNKNKNGRGTIEAVKSLLRCASIYVWFLAELRDQRKDFFKRAKAKAYAKLPGDERPLALAPATTQPGEDVLDDLPLMIGEVEQSRASLLARSAKRR